MIETKMCIKCKGIKDINDFSLETIYSGKVRNPIKNRRTTCKKCRSKIATDHRKTPEGRYKKRLSTIKWRHGLSADEYLEMVDKQENLCAICGKPPGSKALAVDHNHLTNKTRELLCVACNFAIGWFKDDIEVMQKAIQYIYKHQIDGETKPIRKVTVDWGSTARPAKIRRYPGVL